MTNKYDDEIIERLSENEADLIITKEKEIRLIKWGPFTRREDYFYYSMEDIVLSCETTPKIIKYQNRSSALPSLTINQLLKESGYRTLPENFIEQGAPLGSRYVVKRVKPRILLKKFLSSTAEISLAITFEDHPGLFDILLSTNNYLYTVTITNDDGIEHKFSDIIIKEKRIANRNQTILDFPAALIQVRKLLKNIDEIIKVFNFSIKSTLIDDICNNYILKGLSYSGILRKGEGHPNTNYYNDMYGHSNAEHDNENTDSLDLTDEECFLIFGINQNSTLEDLKKAYKKLAQKFHPDMIEGKGLDDSFIEFASMKMQEINCAYEQLLYYFNGA